MIREFTLKAFDARSQLNSFCLDLVTILSLIKMIFKFNIVAILEEIGKEKAKTIIFEILI